MFTIESSLEKKDDQFLDLGFWFLYAVPSFGFIYKKVNLVISIVKLGPIYVGLLQFTISKVSFVLGE